MHPVVQVDESTGLLSAPDGRATLRGSSVYIYLVAAVSAIGGFLFGYDTGIISGAMIFVRDVFQLSSIWQELIVSSTLMTAWLFSILSAELNQRLGRKPVILGAALIFILGSLIMGLASSKQLLLVGRFVVGAGVGLASMTTPIYIAEMAPSSIRGKLVALNMTLITSGQFCSSVVAYGFSLLEDGNEWRYMLALAALPAALQFLIFLPMPESPRWLITNGRSQEARQVLVKTRPKGADVSEELEAIRRGCEEVKKGGQVPAVNKESTFRRIMATPPVRRALIVGCMLQLSQQVSGINTVMYYTASIFEMAGIRSKKRALLMTIAVSFTHFLFTSFTFKFVEKSGRRRLLLISLVGVTASLALLGAGFQVASLNSPPVNHQPANNSHCNQYSNCAACTQDPACGFCYSPSSSASQLQQQSSCLLSNPVDKSHSLFGQCTQAGSAAGNAVFAYEWCPSKYSYLTLLGMVLYLCFFAIGLGPMPWIINSEIYPVWARSWGQAASTSTNWLFNLLVSMSFLTLTQAISKQGAFYLYSGCALASLVYFFFALPETAGLSLEDMERVFAASSWRERINPRRRQPPASQHQQL